MIPQNTATNSLKMMFLVHFLFIAWGIQGSWSPDSYLFYNSVFVLTLIWGVHSPDAEDPIQMGLCVNLLSIFLDIIIFAIYYPSYASLIGSERFSVGMAIINLLLRPLSSFGLYKALQDRAGSTNVAIIPGANANIFNFGQASARGPYEDMDNGRSQAAPVAPQGTGGSADKTYYNIG